MLRNARLPSAVLALTALLAAPHARADWSLLNMTQGVTELSRKIYDLHMLILWVCVAIAVAVFGVMIYALVKFRKSAGAVADTNLTHHTGVEVAWTIVPVLILVVMAIPAAKTLMAIEDTRGTELTVKVTAYQWKWQYEYLDANVGFFSTLARDSDAARQLGSNIDPNGVPNYLLNVDNPLVVPVGTKVRLLVTAQDVIHAWWVPAFGLKKDAIPGFVNEMWFKVDTDKPGLYRGQCTELCGRDHGFMPIVVDARSKEDFDAWLKAKQAEQQQAAAPAPEAAPDAAPDAAPTADAPATAQATSAAATQSAT